jgi:hypothetical protein
MLYVLIILIIAFVTAAKTKDFPETRTRIAIWSLGASALSLALVLVSWNLAFVYFSSMTFLYGMFMLLARIAAGVRKDDGGFYRGN